MDVNTSWGFSFSKHCLTCITLFMYIHLAQSLKRSSTVSGWSFSPFVSCSIINVGIRNACNMSSSPWTQPGSAAYSSTRMLPRYRKQLCWWLWYRFTIYNKAHNLITEVLQPWTHKSKHDITWHDTTFSADKHWRSSHDCDPHLCIKFITYSVSSSFYTETILDPQMLFQL